MRKMQIDKKGLLAICAIVVLVIGIVICAVMCGKKEDKASNKEDGTKQELNITGEESDKDKEYDIPEDASNSEGGLTVEDADDADRQSIEGTVEYVGPDGTGSSNSTGSAGGSNNAGNLEDSEENASDSYGNFF